MDPIIVPMLMGVVGLICAVLVFLKWVDLRQKLSDKDFAIAALKDQRDSRIHEVRDITKNNIALEENWTAAEKKCRLLDLRLRVVKFALECEDDKHLEHILDRRPIQWPWTGVTINPDPAWANKSKS